MRQVDHAAEEAEDREIDEPGNQRPQAEAQQLAIDQPEVARAAILTYLKIPEPIVASMHLQNWVTETVSEEDFQFTADLMVKFGLLSDSEVPAYGDLIRE